MRHRYGPGSRKDSRDPRKWSKVDYEMEGDKDHLNCNKMSALEKKDVMRLGSKGSTSVAIMVTNNRTDRTHTFTCPLPLSRSIFSLNLQFNLESRKP